MHLKPPHMKPKDLVRPIKPCCRMLHAESMSRFVPVCDVNPPNMEFSSEAAFGHAGSLAVRAQLSKEYTYTV